MANILRWNDREIRELEDIGSTVPASLPCGTVVAFDELRSMYIYDPNFDASGLNHYIRSSHRENSGKVWLGVQRHF